MNLKVIVATHKKYKMPKDACYIPVHVGREGKSDLGYAGDNTGDNISLKNPYYCELTGLYWAWKNLNTDYIGLVHYRRHLSFKTKNKKEPFENIITASEIESLLETTDIILPKKRQYYIENLYDHYAHTLYVEPLDKAGEIIKRDYPKYYAEFEKLQNRTSAHMFNMMIMKKEILDGYCQWIFDILGKLEDEVDCSKYDGFHSRFYGRISELLLDVYLNTNELSYKEVSFISMEKVDWWKKGTSFLKAKFLGNKYEKSF